VQIDENTKRAIVDLELDCYSYDHMFWVVVLGLPIVLILVIGAPMVAFLLLLKYIKKGRDNKITQYFLMFTQGYKHSIFYWEFINILRKMILLFMLLVNDIFKILTSAIVLMLTARIQVAFMPYKNNENNRLELFAVAACIITVISYLIYFEKKSVDFLNVLITIFLILMNIVFLLEWFYHLIL
jgi:hypothetical protein